MSAGARRVLAVCSLPACSEIFSRRPCDLKRTPTPYCSRRCFCTTLATGRTMVIRPCAGCGVSVERVLSEVRRNKQVFCTSTCYREKSDFEGLGRAGGSAPHRPVARAVALERSRQGGLARGRLLSPRRLLEISLLGVAARMANRQQVENQARMTRRFGRDVVFGVRLGRRP